MIWSRRGEAVWPLRGRGTADDLAMASGCGPECPSVSVECKISWMVTPRIRSVSKGVWQLAVSE